MSKRPSPTPATVPPIDAPLLVLAWLTIVSAVAAAAAQKITQPKNASATRTPFRMCPPSRTALFDVGGRGSCGIAALHDFWRLAPLSAMVWGTKEP
jgi:hypothetical protein